jgi:DMSO/TMAO reductase YedYZ molybdopterin-dependent catalytic subunit
MVLSPIHFAPSAAAAILALIVGIWGRSGSHKLLGYGLAGFALIGVVGFLISDWRGLNSLNFHSVHALIGLAALVSSLIPTLGKRLPQKIHCKAGKLAAVLSLVSLGMGVMIILGQTPIFGGPGPRSNSTQIPVGNILPEVEAGSYQGVTLTPISQQGNNAIKGTQIIDRDSYRLVVAGLVQQELSLTYSDLMKFPAYELLAYMPCVEGWGFYAKWTGFRITDLIDSAVVIGGGDYVMFYTADGYSTGLPLNYLVDRRILLAYGLNDVTLPIDRGFPLQLVAESKYGYKWAKWIVRVEVVKGEVLGYWESRGYSNSADEGGFPFS